MKLSLINKIKIEFDASPIYMDELILLPVHNPSKDVSDSLVRINTQDKTLDIIKGSFGNTYSRVSKLEESLSISSYTDYTTLKFTISKNGKIIYIRNISSDENLTIDHGVSKSYVFVVDKDKPFGILNLKTLVFKRVHFNCDLSIPSISGFIHVGSVEPPNYLYNPETDERIYYKGIFCYTDDKIFITKSKNKKYFYLVEDAEVKELDCLEDMKLQILSIQDKVKELQSFSNLEDEIHRAQDLIHFQNLNQIKELQMCSETHNEAEKAQHLRLCDKIKKLKARFDLQFQETFINFETFKEEIKKVLETYSADDLTKSELGLVSSKDKLLSLDDKIISLKRSFDDKIVQVIKIIQNSYNSVSTDLDEKLINVKLSFDDEIKSIVSDLNEKTCLNSKDIEDMKSLVNYKIRKERQGDTILISTYF